MSSNPPPSWQASSFEDADSSSTPRRSARLQRTSADQDDAMDHTASYHSLSSDHNRAQPALFAETDDEDEDEDFEDAPVAFAEDDEDEDEEEDEDDEDVEVDDDDDDFDLEAVVDIEDLNATGGAAEATANVLLQFIRNTTQDRRQGGGGRPQQMAPADFFRLIQQAGRFGRRTDDDDDEEEHARGYGSLRARRRPTRNADDYPKVPSDEGRKLMESGLFGTNEHEDGCLRFSNRKKLAARIMRRELGLESPGQQRSVNRLAAQSLIPSSQADTIIHYAHRCYSGQFSDDGNFFFSCAQDFRVRMYDTSNPYNWKYYKTVTYPYGQWTITDASLSPDNKYLAYSSIRSIVCLAATDPNDDSEPYLLDFARHNPRQGDYYSGNFGIWSVRFSGDGRELVAGTSDHSVYVYDIETRQSILRIRGHEDDVNAVCFGDKTSPHLLYSGSDDTTLKVWDRRSMSDNREAGVFLGHTEGLTYVDSKGDGRYVLSNGKDQTMKLWDLRKMMSADQAERIDIADHSTGFDYRFQPYDAAMYRKHPYDSSVVTFRGHRVLKTLIRCHFSPPGSTDSRYVYSGSEDGSVYIYNLDATEAGRVNVTKATKTGSNGRPGHSRDGSNSSNGSAAQDDTDDEAGFLHIWDERRGGTWKTCVRDAAWHPYAPLIAATSWNGPGMTQGTCSVHSWNDAMADDECETPAMGQRVDPVLRPCHGFPAHDNDGPRRANRGRARGYDM